MPNDFYAERYRIISSSIDWTMGVYAGGANPNGIITEPTGSLLKSSDGRLWRNVGGSSWLEIGDDGAQAWSQTAVGTEGTVLSAVLPQAYPSNNYYAFVTNYSGSYSPVFKVINKSTTGFALSSTAPFVAGDKIDFFAVSGGLGPSVADGTAIANLSGTINARFASFTGSSSGGSSSGSGLFGPTIGTIPTLNSTGFGTSPSTPTWNNQITGSTVTERPNGLVVYGPNGGASLVRTGVMRRSAPATPYTITACIAVVHTWATNAASAFGFTDGNTSAAKFQGFIWKPVFAEMAVVNCPRLDGTGGTTSNVATISPATMITAPPYWFRLTDNGTTVTYEMSPTGDEGMWLTFASVTKAGSFLGASGFVNVTFGVLPYASDTRAQLLSWAIT